MGMKTVYLCFGTRLGGGVLGCVKLAQGTKDDLLTPSQFGLSACLHFAQITWVLLEPRKSGGGNTASAQRTGRLWQGPFGEERKPPKLMLGSNRTLKSPGTWFNGPRITGHFSLSSLKFY